MPLSTVQPIRNVTLARTCKLARNKISISKTAYFTSEYSLCFTQVKYP